MAFSQSSSKDWATSKRSKGRSKSKRKGTARRPRGIMHDEPYFMKDSRLFSFDEVRQCPKLSRLYQNTSPKDLRKMMKKWNKWKQSLPNQCVKPRGIRTKSSCPPIQAITASSVAPGCKMQCASVHSFGIKSHWMPQGDCLSDPFMEIDLGRDTFVLAISIKGRLSQRDKDFQVTVGYYRWWLMESDHSIYSMERGPYLANGQYDGYSIWIRQEQSPKPSRCKRRHYKRFRGSSPPETPWTNVCLGNRYWWGDGDKEVVQRLDVSARRIRIYQHFGIRGYGHIDPENRGTASKGTKRERARYWSENEGTIFGYYGRRMKYYRREQERDSKNRFKQKVNGLRRMGDYRLDHDVIAL